MDPASQTGPAFRTCGACGASIKPDDAYLASTGRCAFCGAVIDAAAGVSGGWPLLRGGSDPQLRRLIMITASLLAIMMAAGLTALMMAGSARTTPPRSGPGSLAARNRDAIETARTADGPPAPAIPREEAPRLPEASNIRRFAATIPLDEFAARLKREAVRPEFRGAARASFEEDAQTGRAAIRLHDAHTAYTGQAWYALGTQELLLADDGALGMILVCDLASGEARELPAEAIRRESAAAAADMARSSRVEGARVRVAAQLIAGGLNLTAALIELPRFDRPVRVDFCYSGRALLERDAPAPARPVAPRPASERDRARRLEQSLTTGLTYAEVCDALGGEGRRTMAMGDTVVYVWEPAPGESVEVTFEGGALIRWRKR